MKISVLCNSRLAIPAIQQLALSGELKGVGVPDRAHEDNEEISYVCNRLNIPVHTLQHTGLETNLVEWIKKWNPDVVLVFTFPYKIPETVLPIPDYGFINFHFGLLPAYRGSDAIFWQIKNREPMGGISVHQMTGELDRGPIYFIQKVAIVPDDTYGSHSNALSFAGAGAVSNLLLMLKQGKQATAQNEQEAYYYHRPTLEDVMIDWTKPADDIIALINACNPWNKGAFTIQNNTPAKIIHAYKITYEEKHHLPGFIKSITDKGLLVCCSKNDHLLIQTIFVNNEFLNSCRFQKTSWKEGFCFYNP